MLNFVARIGADLSAAAPRLVTGLVLSIAGLYLPGMPNLAQAADGVIEEVIVTAQKRNQNVQDVPISITALTAAEIERRNVEDVLDVAYKTPGVVGALQAGVPSFVIRGIGTNDFGSAADPAVGIYLDGVYTARTVASLIGLYDAERIEVIKGPQGTLFGRSAAAGAISVISRKPDATREFSAKLEYGNYDHTRVLASANLPLSDTAFLRVAALSHQRDGYIENKINGDELGDVDDKGVRAALRLLPADNLDITLSADYIKSDTLGVGLRSATIVGYPGTGTSKFDDVAHDITDPVSELENMGASLHAKLDLTDQLSLTSITAYREYEFTILEDDDGSFVELLATGTLPEQSDTFSQELRLDWSGEHFSWMLGASYFQEDISVDGIAQSNLDVLFGPGSGGAFDERSYSSGDYTSYSIYADVTVELSERTTLIAGLRWSYDEKDFELFVPPNPAIGVNLLFGGVDPQAQLDEDWDSVQPRAVLQYRPAKDVMTYISAARGYKTGGFGSFELQPPFDPDYVWYYESGVKSSLADGTMQLNAAVFYYDYEDLLVTPQVGLALQTTNASEASGQGAEVEMLWLPTPALSLSASVAYLDAEYDKFLQGELDPFTFLPTTTDRSGNTLTRAPEWQYNLGAEYDLQLGNLGVLTIGTEYVFQSEVFFHTANDDFRSQDDYGLLAARIALTAPDGGWQVSLFGENLLGEDYLIDAGGLAEVLLSPTTLAGPPMTFGVELEFNL